MAWLVFSAAALVTIGGLGALALLSGSGAPGYSVAVIPPLDEARQPAAPAPDISHEPGADVAPEVVPPRPSDAARVEESAPLPPPRPAVAIPPERPGAQLDDASGRAAARDHWTAVYDISAHVVFLPDGRRLEAHSGLGPLQDDPRSVSEVDRGATPPHLYELSLREDIFHGVQALRLSPIGDGEMFGRNGLLAHPYMLGPKGESNGCVSFKDYDAFLKAYQSGQVKRLAVVGRLE